MRVACCVCVRALCCVCVLCLWCLCCVQCMYAVCACVRGCVRVCVCVRMYLCGCLCMCGGACVRVWLMQPRTTSIGMCVCVCVRACVWVAQLYANDQFCMLSLACPWSAAATMLQAYMATKLVAPTEPGLVARACCAHGCDHLTQHRSSTSSSLGLVAPTGETV